MVKKFMKEKEENMNNRKFELIPGVENCAGEMKVAFPIEENQNR